ncbi:MAG: patatin-like phospholipase family protein [Gimesia sp.]
MSRVGLALSGGGFRATLYHLGVIRYLRDAGTLQNISQITSVSGGSILAAHLLLNWDRYCGTDEEFAQAADEIIRFTKMDVRNRIVRRFPFSSTANSIRRIFRKRTKRQSTRPGLLEKHYEQFLYGDTGLCQLPAKPHLHMLSTNLSEGCLCSFDKYGLLFQRRTPGKRDFFERVPTGLGTVPMAVAASSAFPGFFPPLVIRGDEIGADAGTFGTQAFSDGGVFDNLGLRMFRCIEQSWIKDTVPLSESDILEIDDVIAALISAKELSEEAPLRRLRELLIKNHPVIEKKLQSGDHTDLAMPFIQGLWEVIRSEELFRDSRFQGMELSDPGAQSLLQFLNSSNHIPEMSDRIWLNRILIEAALQKVIGKPCIRQHRDGFDAILVSDAGKMFEVSTGSRAGGGLISTALRSTDILMDRVYQLEMESFQNSSGVVFMQMTDVVEPARDRFAPRPEIQRQIARIRTDLDRFSDLEVSALVQHGYCVARNAFRKRSDLLDAKIPQGPPWDPAGSIPSDSKEPSTGGIDFSDVKNSLKYARQIQGSAGRRVWKTLFSHRDAYTYVWIPLLIVIMLSLPYYFYKLNEQAKFQNTIINAITQTSPIYKESIQLLTHAPITKIDSLPYEDVKILEPVNYSGFKITSDTRIYDLRNWSFSDDKLSSVFVHERIHVQRTEENSDNNHLRIQATTTDENLLLRIKNKRLNPTLSRMRLDDDRYRWEIDLDMSGVPIGRDTEIVIEKIIETESTDGIRDEGRFQFSVPMVIGVVEMWMLMPEGHSYEYFEVSRYLDDDPDKVYAVTPDVKVELPYGSIATFRLINPESKSRYECRWSWQDD